MAVDEERTLSYSDIDYDGIHRPVPSLPIDFFLTSCPHCEFPVNIRADLLYKIFAESDSANCQECDGVINLMEVKMTRLTNEYAMGIMHLDAQLARIAD